MSLRTALDVVLQLKGALATEVQRSREVRTVLRAMDSRALLEQATLRDAFNHHSRWLSSELARGLAEFSAEQGLGDLTLEQIRARAPLEGALLADGFAEIRALSTSLAELDAFNHELSQRALTFVQAYVNTFAPRASAYTRRGQPAPLEAATLSERA
jgi:hypothetical protein